MWRRCAPDHPVHTKFYCLLRNKFVSLRVLLRFASKDLVGLFSYEMEEKLEENIKCMTNIVVANAALYAPYLEKQSLASDPLGEEHAT